MSELYIVATPIGNLSDMTYRAVETLKSVDFVAAEDTRHARILFKHYEIETPLVSFHARTGEAKTLDLSKKIVQGKSCALISDAGTPCVSDPGFRLVKLASDMGVKVIPIPGPSALTTLISASGFPADKFVFHGFLPHKKGRQTIIKNLVNIEKSHIFYESVHRFPKLLKELKEHVSGNRKICVGRELTKMHEEIFRGTVDEALVHFVKENTRGEFVVLVAPEKF